MSEHTPGPWFFDENDSNYMDRRSDDKATIKTGPDDEWHIAAIHGAPGWEANARLIAAAPELLASCEEMLTALLDDCQDTQRWADIMQGANTVINKAKGK